MNSVKNLTILFLFNTKVSDGSIEYLSKINSLVHLDIRGTNITLDGLKRLKIALPGCKIRCDHAVDNQNPSKSKKEDKKIK